MILRILKMSSTALKENKLRSILTALGIIIGTAIVIIVLSVGSGIKALILEQMASITSDTLWVEIDVPSEATGYAKYQQSASSIGGGVQITSMTLDDVEDIRKIPNVALAAGMSIAQEKLVVGSNEKRTMIWATEADFAKAENLEFSEGGFYTDNEDRAYSRVIVIGTGLKETLFGVHSAIGKKIKIRNQTFTVVGVLKETGIKFFMNMDDLAYIPIRTTQKFLLGIDYIMAMEIKMIDSSQIYLTIKQIEKQLRKNHDITDPKKDDFAVRTQEESMDIVNTVTSGISILLFALGVISLIVGGVGIMNVMYVAVSERTKEIGLKKALGAKPYVIKFQYIFEAVIISIIGGVMGIFLGIFISWAISALAQAFDFNWPFVVEIYAVFLAVSISVFLGITFGYAPASKAASLDPIEAIRRG